MCNDHEVLPWKVTLLLEGKLVWFKADSGPDTTVVIEYAHIV